MLKPKIPIAYEGYPFIVITAFLAIIFAIIDASFLLSVSLAATAFITYFFRDPERFTPDLEDAVICPADGKIIVIDKVDDEQFTGEKAIKVSVFMNVFNVHVNRIPMDGTVDKIIYKPGKFYSADTEKSAEYNEYCATVMTNGKGQRLAFVQVAGLIARRIVCWLEPKDQVKTGWRFGLIRFGSRVDLYLPESAEIKVQMGQKVIAGETVMATLSEAS